MARIILEVISIGIQYSYSRVDLYERCPYHFKLKYLDKLTELPNYTADNPLILGSAMHLGIETNVETALDFYFKSYPIITDEIINESIKLEILIPKVHEWLSQFEGAEVIHEYEINTNDYKGFVDLIVRDGDETLVVDFKYSNSIETYKQSNQLHVYKHQLDQLGFNVTRLGYLFIEKKYAKYKKNESSYHHRKRIEELAKEAQLTYVPIEYDEHKSLSFDWSVQAIERDDTWEKNPHGECFACNAIEAKQEGRWTPILPPDYLEAIQNETGEILMVLPKNERRDVTKITKRILWEYGAPFSGKTWFANSFPDVLMLNTDGNIKFVDAPYVNIADKVKKVGHIKKTTLAWDILDETLSELETSDHTFKTIVFDLLEDLYTAARFKVYEELNIDHESDNSFKAWDIVTTKFLQAVKRIINLDVENIIFISHEDISKDITKRTGDKITSIQPNLREKVALKVAGMVDIVGRVVTDGDERKLVFKSQSYVFSGGRIPNMPVDEIELTYEKFVEVYETANKGLSKPEVTVEETTDLSEIDDVEQVKPKRGRRKKEVNDAPTKDKTNDTADEMQSDTESDDDRPKVVDRVVEDVVQEHTPSDDSDDAGTPSDEPQPRRQRRSRATKAEPTPVDEENGDEKDGGKDNEESPRPRRRRRRSRE